MKLGNHWAVAKLGSTRQDRIRTRTRWMRAHPLHERSAS